MTIAYDVVSGGSRSGSTTAVTWSHTCSGSDRVLVVAFAVGFNHAPVTATVTYGGSAMTYLGRMETNGPGTGWGYVELWAMNAPPVGAATVSISMTTFSSLIGMAMSFTGATGWGTLATNYGGASVGPSGSASLSTGDMVAWAAACGSSLATSTPVYDREQNLDTGSGAGNMLVAHGTAATFSAANSADYWAVLGLPIHVAGAGLSLAGTVTATSSVVGALGSPALAGAAPATSAVVGSLRSPALAGVVAAVVALSGALGSAGLAGTAHSSSTSSGTLGSPAPTLAGVVAGISTTAGAFAAAGMSGTVTAISGTTGALGSPAIAGTVTAVTTTLGALDASGLAGLVAATSSTTGALGIPGALRDITVTIVGPGGNPLAITGPLGNPFTIAGPSGNPLNVIGPRS
jgi:hypothetical protein